MEARAGGRDNATLCPECKRHEGPQGWRHAWEQSCENVAASESMTVKMLGAELLIESRKVLQKLPTCTERMVASLVDISATNVATLRNRAKYLSAGSSTTASSMRANTVRPSPAPYQHTLKHLV